MTGSSTERPDGRPERAVLAHTRHDVIRVRGARTHNLRDLSFDIPKHRLTVFTGVSGSGKSSLVLDTIAAESERLLNETYSTFLQGFMPAIARPDVDVLEGLTATIVVDQRRLGADPRSTVGTATDANALLRILFSRLGRPPAGPPSAYSFNVASVRASGAITVERGARRAVRATFSRTGGMCPRCEGRGDLADLDVRQLLDETRSLAEGAILVPGYTVENFFAVRPYLESGLLDPDKPIRDYSERELDDLLRHEPTRLKISGVNVTYEGLIPKLERSFLSRDPESLQPHLRAFLERAVTRRRCPDCGGTRLAGPARASLVGGINIADACAMQVGDLADWVRSLEVPSVAPLLTKLAETLDALLEVGLGYLSLDRASGSLSGGEAQRVKILHLASSLTDVTYVLDEPTTGLHPHDVARLNGLLVGLRDRGNTVLVVEHDPQVIEVADHVVDLGPGAGEAGGAVCFAGSVEALRQSGTCTGSYLDAGVSVKPAPRTPTGALELRGVCLHNLHDVDVDMPLGVLVVLTGVAGSGKSSLVQAGLAGREGVVLVDQHTSSGSRRSNPATYTGLLEPVRRAFAKANGVAASLFSSNSEGACPACGGAGVLETDLRLLAGAALPCEDCDGRRFRPEVLAYRLGGRDIAAVLDLTVADAVAFFGAGEARVPAAQAIAQRLDAAGLGYLRLGQPLTTLSGGERQRLELATHPARSGQLLVLDEPTTGLHPADVEQLLGLLDRLVDDGTSIVVIEHNRSVVAHADWVIDLGPGAGHEGGRVVFDGTPAELAVAATITGEYLAAALAGRDGTPALRPRVSPRVSSR